MVLNCKGHPSFGMGRFLQLQPPPFRVGLASSQRLLEDMGVGVGLWPGQRWEGGPGPYFFIPSSLNP